MGLAPEKQDEIFLFGARTVLQVRQAFPNKYLFVRAEGCYLFPQQVFLRGAGFYVCTEALFGTP